MKKQAVDGDLNVGRCGTRHNADVADESSKIELRQSGHNKDRYEWTGGRKRDSNTHWLTDITRYCPAFALAVLGRRATVNETSGAEGVGFDSFRRVEVDRALVES